MGKGITQAISLLLWHASESKTDLTDEVRKFMARVFDAPIISNDQSLDRLLASSLPVLILFWNGEELSDSINQAMLRLANQKAGELIVAKINKRDNPEATRRFNVSQTPLLVGIRGGNEVMRTVLMSASDIAKHAQYVLERMGKPAPQVSEQPRPKREVRTSRGEENRPTHVTDATFEQMVLHAGLPVLVDFWAPWCGPCHALAPVLDRLARDFAGRIRIAKVNVDDNPHYAGLYGVQGIPTLLMFRNGQVVDRLVGVVPENYLRAKIEHLLQVN